MGREKAAVNDKTRVEQEACDTYERYVALRGESETFLDVVERTGIDPFKEAVYGSA